MNCERVEELILEDMISAEVEAHLMDCPRCLMLVRRQRELDDELRAAYAAPTLSSNFSRSLRRRIRAEKTERFRDFLPEAGALAAGVAATLLCAWLRPENAAALAIIGFLLTLIANLAPSLADWLTEELEKEP